MQKYVWGPVCVDIAGTTLTEHERERLAHPLVGMVILFTRNYRNRRQLRALCDRIHAVHPGIVIAVDHEGGRVQRFRSRFTRVAAMATLRGRNAYDHFFAAGLVLAYELRRCGVDFTFAPVLDIDYGRSQVIGDRSLGSNVQEVTRNAQALIRGLRAGGMGACGKHYPGHGWARADSHHALPVDRRRREKIIADAQMYADLGTELTSLMTAHVLYPAVDQQVSTFSSIWLQDILRKELGFTGLVFSDDLTMKGAGQSSITQRARMALQAGCDVVLVCNAPRLADELLENLRWNEPVGFREKMQSLLPSTPCSTVAYQEALSMLGYQEA